MGVCCQRCQPSAAAVVAADATSPAAAAAARRWCVTAAAAAAQHAAAWPELWSSAVGAFWQHALSVPIFCADKCCIQQCCWPAQQCCWQEPRPAEHADQQQQPPKQKAQQQQRQQQRATAAADTAVPAAAAGWVQEGSSWAAGWFVEGTHKLPSGKVTPTACLHFLALVHPSSCSSSSASSSLSCSVLATGMHAVAG